MNPLAAQPGPRLSNETVHASTVAIDGRAVMITGPSGAGKSDLALRLLDRGFTLVSDDQTIVRRDGDRLIATAPPSIAGKLEIRGIGIVELDRIENLPIERLPEDGRERPILGVNVPFITIDAMTASAPAKVAIALDRTGVKFT